MAMITTGRSNPHAGTVSLRTREDWLSTAASTTEFGWREHDIINKGTEQAVLPSDAVLMPSLGKKRQLIEHEESSEPGYYYPITISDRPRKKMRCHSDPEIYHSNYGAPLLLPREFPIATKPTRFIGTQTDLPDFPRQVIKDEKADREYGSLFGSISGGSTSSQPEFINPCDPDGARSGINLHQKIYRSSTNKRDGINTSPSTQDYHTSDSPEYASGQQKPAWGVADDSIVPPRKNDEDEEDSSFLPQDESSLKTAPVSDASGAKKPPSTRGADTPPAMSCELMPHQRIGLQWLLDHELGPDKGGILADDMGLGKTIQALALILANPPKDPRRKTTLIVAPLALLKQWPREIDQKIKPGHKLRVHIYHGEGRKTRDLDKLLSYDVILTNYETLQREWRCRMDPTVGTVLINKDMVFHRIILDEAHLIKNPETQTANAVFALNATYRLAMSGTPLMNRAEELYSLMAFLGVKPYNNWTVFFMSICKTIFDPKTNRSMFKLGATRRVKELRERTMLIRSKKDLIDDRPIVPLPPCHVTKVEVQFAGDFDAKVYQECAARADALGQRMRRTQTGPVGQFAMALRELLRLRQACLHPSLLTEQNNDDSDARREYHEAEGPLRGDLMKGPPNKRATERRRAREKHFRQLEAEYQPSGKINKILELLSSIRAKNPRDRTIIFTFFTSFLDVLEVALGREKGFKWQRFDGTMTPAAKDAAVANFMSAKNDTNLMLTSLRSGNAGLNLTIATHVIIAEPYWNPYVEQQAIDRAHRIGQTREVTVYKLIIPSTVEEMLLRKQEQKKQVVGWALGNGEGEGGGHGMDLTKKDVIELLTFFNADRPLDGEFERRAEKELDRIDGDF